MDVIKFNRQCYKCGKRYVYYRNGENNGNGWRLCADCRKDTSIKWTCSCGEQFNTRNELMEHRHAVRASGGWCGKFYNDMDLRCPLCGKLISKAHENNRPSECIRNHLCPGLKEFHDKYNINMSTILDIKEKLKKCESADYIDVPTDSVMQMIWLQDRLKDISNEYRVRIVEATEFVIILAIPKLNMFFIFDMIKNFWMEKWNQALGIMGWQGITIKWTDCILGKDNYEQKVSEAIKNRINIIERKKLGGD